MGRLDEDLSCANSRFFRTTLYPDAAVADLLRDKFVLHWSSERDVPRVTVDFGDGDHEKFLLGARENLGEGDTLDVYSPESAMGAAINGKSKGDKVTYTAPNGKDLTVKIVDAEPYKA